jgi:hypothetical protein
VVHVIYHLKIIIGIMIVLYVNVVEVHLLVEVFSPKDQIFFVLIVVNHQRHIIKWKMVTVMVDNVVLLVSSIKQIKTKIFFRFFFLLFLLIIQRAFCDEKQNKTKNERLGFSSFLNDKLFNRFVCFLSFIPLKHNESEISKSSLLPFCSFFFFSSSLHCVSFFVLPLSLSYCSFFFR